MTGNSRPTLLGRVRALTDGTLLLAAWGILALLVLRAMTSIDTSHDTWWYHLPFAAILAGLIPADAFVLDAHLQSRFEGFPLVFDWMQGWLWRLTGRPEASNLVALGTLALFPVFLRLRFGVPWHLGFLALIGVPLIQIHATAAHVDLPSNLGLAVALLLLVPLWDRRQSWRWGDLGLFLAGCALAAHGKLQLVPVAGLTLGIGIMGLAWRWLGERRAGDTATNSPVSRPLTLALLAVPLVLWVPLENAVQHGNPLYPVAVKLGPIDLAGPETGYLSHSAREERLAAHRARAAEGQQAPTPAQAARRVAPAASPGDSMRKPQSRPETKPLNLRVDPVMWARSVLGVGLAPLAGRGQWSLLGAQRPPLPPRYGGYFGWYVILHLIAFAVLVALRPRTRWPLALLLLAVTLVTAFQPVATILRYYMYWMILLISLNLIMITQGLTGRRASSDGQRVLGAAGLVAFLLVVYATRAEYVQPRFYFVEDLLEVRRDPSILEQVASNPATCLVGERAARFFIYSDLFNPGADYRLKVGPLAGDYARQIGRACGPGWTVVIAERKDAGIIPSPKTQPPRPN